MTEYKLFNSEGTYLRSFHSYKRAEEYKQKLNKPNWVITKFKPSSNEEKDQVYFVENILYINFEGDINNSYDIIPFLESFLEDAKLRNGEYEEYLNMVYRD